MYRNVYLFLLMVTLMSSLSVSAALIDKQGSEIAQIQSFRNNDPAIRILREGGLGTYQDNAAIYGGAYGSYYGSYGNPTPYYGTYDYGYPSYPSYPYSAYPIYANPYMYPGVYYYNPGMYNPNTTFVNPPNSMNYPTGYPSYSETYIYR